MHNGEYGLGIDIGEDTVTAAICRRTGEADTELLALPVGGTVTVTEDGQVRLTESGPGSGSSREWPTAGAMARVGTPTPHYLGDRAIPAAELVTAIVDRVRTVAESQEGRPPARTVLTVPPSWGEYRRDVLTEALVDSDRPATSLVSGALAATYHHVTTGRLPDRATVAVFDLGASTLDTAVVGPTADGDLDHLAVPPAPVPWGGRNIDDALLGHVLSCLDQTLDSPGPTVPDPTGARGRLRALRAGSVAAKEALSSRTATLLDVQPHAVSLRVTREDLDDLIAAGVQESVTALRQALAGAGVTADGLDGLVLAGGSVRVPLVAEKLSAELGCPLVVDSEPELTAARGAASLAAAGIADEADAIEPEEPAHRPPRLRRVRRSLGARVSRPPTRPPAAPGPHPGGRSGAAVGSRFGRVLIVAGMFVALVLAVPALTALVSAARWDAAAGTPSLAAPVAAAAGPAAADATSPTGGTPAEQGGSYAGVRVSASAQSAGGGDPRPDTAGPGIARSSVPSTGVRVGSGGNPGTGATSPGTPLAGTATTRDPSVAAGSTQPVTPPPVTGSSAAAPPPSTSLPSAPPPSAPPPSTPPAVSEPPPAVSEPPPATDPAPQPVPAGDPAPQPPADPGTGITAAGTATL